MGGMLRQLYLAWFSQPAGERFIYRHIRRARAHRLLELGVGTTLRSQRMIETAARAQGQRVEFTGVDLFELRPQTGAEGVSLRLAHRQLAKTGARVRLVPGDPLSALSRVANGLGPQDLVLISADQDRDSLAAAWFYVPRLLTPATQVYLEEAAEGHAATWRLLSHEEIATLAAPKRQRRAA